MAQPRLSNPLARRFLGGMLAIPETVGTMAGNLFFDVGATGAQALADPAKFVRAALGNRLLAEEFQADRTARRDQLPTLGVSPGTQAAQQSVIEAAAPTVRRVAERYPNATEFAIDYLNDPSVQTMLQGIEALGLPVMRAARSFETGIRGDLMADVMGDTVGDAIGGMMVARAPGADTSIFVGPKTVEAAKGYQIWDKGTRRDKPLKTSHGELTPSELEASLAAAVAIEQAGGDPWPETGWFRGAEGKWRFELDDSDARLREEGARPGLSHPANFALDDATGEIKTVVREGDEEGAFGKAFDQPTIFVSGPYQATRRRIALHETQHALQQYEGFARGGHPRQFETQPESYAIQHAEVMAELDHVLKAADNAGVDYREFAESPPRWLSDEGVRLLKLWGHDRKILEGNIASTLRYALTPYERYRRLAGEVEARNVETRADMTPEQRRAQPPGTTEDVLFGEQEVRMSPSGLAASTLYHGSPYEFDRFDMTKTGTGLGPHDQAHGLYFSETAQGAKVYQDLARPKEATVRLEGGQFRATYRDRQDRFHDLGRFPDKKTANEAVSKATGHMYEVDIPGEAINKMLDWNAPLNKQPASVQEAIKRATFYDQDRVIPGAKMLQELGDMPGRNVYDLITKGSFIGGPFANRAAQQAAASKLWNELGVPGVKYLEEMGGTRNVVVFDDTLITPLKRNGEPLARPFGKKEFPAVIVRDTSSSEASVKNVGEELREILAPSERNTVK